MSKTIYIEYSQTYNLTTYSYTEVSLKEMCFFSYTSEHTVCIVKAVDCCVDWEMRGHFYIYHDAYHVYPIFIVINVITYNKGLPELVMY